MINCKDGDVSLRGDGKALLVDFSMIAASIYNTLVGTFEPDIADCLFDAGIETAKLLHNTGNVTTVDTTLLKEILENRGYPNGKN